MTDAELKAAAEAAREAAYAPYSGFRVGCALLAEDGAVYSGCNVENASYGLAVCAERSAVSAAIRGGARRIERVAITSDLATPVSPCGACRQTLAEFCEDATPVICYGAAGGERRWTVAELLPDAFWLRTDRMA